MNLINRKEKLIKNLYNQLCILVQNYRELESKIDKTKISDIGKLYFLEEEIHKKERLIEVQKNKLKELKEQK